METQDRRMLTAVDDIRANQANLRLTDEAGNEVAGRLPGNLRQFAEAVDQTKRRIFEEYDALATQAGGQGLRIETAPMVEKLREFANRVDVRDLNPRMAAEIEAEATRFEARGSYTPKEAQELVKTLNREARAFWNNPQPGLSTRAGAMTEAAKALRETLDNTIERGGGAGYQALKNRYGALKSIETDVAKAAQRNLANTPGGLGGMFTDVGTVVELLHGAMDPTKLPRAIGFQAAKQWLKFTRDPNVAVTRLFQARERGAASPAGSAFTDYMQEIAPTMGGLAGGQLGADLDRPPPPRTPRPSVVGP